MCQTQSPLRDRYSLPTLGGAFAALFQAEILPYTHGHTEQRQSTDSAQMKQNKDFQASLSIYLRQSLKRHMRVYTVDRIYAQKHNVPHNQGIKTKLKKSTLMSK